MNKIGFLSKNETTKTINKKENVIYTFDSGYSLSQEDAKLHTIILGTTGTGKTASIFLPILYGSMSLGECGLIIDIKGNLREQVRSLAKACNRSKDILEYGLSDTAIPCNIISNMNPNEFYNFIEVFIDFSIDKRTNNKDFTVRGLMQCVQMLKILRLYNNKRNLFSPTLKDIYDLLINPMEASKIFSAYKEKYYNKDDFEERILVSAIESNAFHIFLYEQKLSEGKSTYFEQLNYAIEMIRTVLCEILEVKNFEKNFAAKGCCGIDIRNNFYRNCITVLRFSPGTGKVGAFFSRYIISKYYETVFEMEPKNIAEYPSFICIDEFQEVAVLNNYSKLSDTAFVAQAREFRASFIASTQSASSLMCNRNNLSGVKSFIANCNTRIYLRTDDPMTQDLVNSYDKSCRLFELEHGKVFITGYSHSEKALENRNDSVNESYRKIQDILSKKEYLCSPDEIKANNKILLNLLCRDEKRVLSEKEKIKFTEKENFLNNQAVIKIYDRDNKLECKIQIRAFMQDYLHFFESDMSQRVYVPLSWQKKILLAFQRFHETGENISILNLKYNEVHNCAVIEVFEELDEEENRQAKKAEELLNSFLVESFENALG